MTDIPFKTLYKLQQELLSASLEDGDVEQRAAQAIVAMYERDQANDAEVRRLRKLIKDAPHAPGCRIREFFTRGNGPKPCTCWKADVL